MDLLLARFWRLIFSMEQRCNTSGDRLAALRAWMRDASVDGIILPVTDEFQGEYSAAYARRVTWLTGFDGSAGMAVVLADKAALLVDGRYTLQAAQEVDAALYDIYNSGEMSIGTYLREHAQGKTIGYDPWLMTGKQIDRLAESLGKIGRLIALDANPIDTLWQNQPMRPLGKLRIHALVYAGKSHEDKLDELAAELRAREVSCFPITTPDTLCWLLNIRGEDVPFNPLPLAYGLAHADGSFDLYTEATRLTEEVREHLGPRVRVHPPHALVDDLKRLAGQARIGYDPEQSPIWFRQVVEHAGQSVIVMSDPCQLAKAMKNEAEMAGMRQAHVVDGVAVTRFLCWLDRLDLHEPLDELEVVRRLEDMRQRHPDYLGPSFATIAGSGPHGAIVHYRATETSSRTIAPHEILLLDSGGQYVYGTTDITRTVARGQTNDEFRQRFTLVLKGHIALAQARFPVGTSGVQLDVLAREPLWQFGLDYDHGTGHGVGAHLCVHEGPQRISKRGSDVALRPGMILSNEPGYYHTGEYGIRIENLVLVTEKERSHGRIFLGFETLTLCPIDTRLIELKLLNDAERAWMNHYHQRVYEALSPSLDEVEKAWLLERTQPI